MPPENQEKLINQIFQTLGDYITKIIANHKYYTKPRLPMGKKYVFNKNKMSNISN